MNKFLGKIKNFSLKPGILLIAILFVAIFPDWSKDQTSCTIVRLILLPILTIGFIIEIIISFSKNSSGHEKNRKESKEIKYLKETMIVFLHPMAPLAILTISILVNFITAKPYQWSSVPFYGAIFF